LSFLLEGYSVGAVIFCAGISEFVEVGSVLLVRKS